MNVSSFTNAFQQNQILSNRPLQSQPINDTLKRFSENLLKVKSKEKDMQSRFDTFEMSLEAVEQKEDSSLSEIPDELLKAYLHLYEDGANMSQENEKYLMEYREQLSAFDQTIQEYQNMLDGRSEIPEKMKPEDVANLLHQTKTAREEFLQKGANVLDWASKRNQLNTQEGFMGRAYQKIAGEKNDNQIDSQWSVDTSAENIYSEIDRALASAHKVTSVFREGASRILAELRRRGYGNEQSLQLSAEDQATINSGYAERQSPFQAILDNIWATVRKNAIEA